MVKAIILLFGAYYTVGTIFLLMILSGHITIELADKKTRQKVGEYRHIHFVVLPILAISSIFANKMSKKGGRQR